MKANHYYLFILVLLSMSMKSIAQSDPTFGTEGIVILDPGNNNSSGGTAIAAQPDGKVVCGAYSGKPNNVYTDFLLIRYNPTGTLDSTFGTNGIVTTVFTNFGQLPADLAILPDGKILALEQVNFSWTTFGFGLSKYNSDGSLDTEFGIEGKKTYPLNNESVPASVAIQSDGKILVGGWTWIPQNNAVMVLMRMNQDGTLDDSFGSGGIATYDINPTTTDWIKSIAIQPDGKIVGAGFTGPYSTLQYSCVVVRFNPDGSIDGSFGDNGRTILDPTTSEDKFSDVKILGNGRIIAAGFADRDFFLAQFKSDGNLDTDFGTNGTATADFNAFNDYIRELEIQQDGKIIAIGVSGSLNYSEFAFARYLPNGTLDQSFGTDGLFSHTVSQQNGPYVFDGPRSADLQSDGKLVVTGETLNNSLYNIVTTRYLSDLNVGVLNHAHGTDMLMVYPNPIDARTTLKYSLKQPDNISIQLIDAQGTVVRNLVRNEIQEAGTHTLEIELPGMLQSGAYFIVIGSPKGKTSIQVFK